ncbi:hypothetical protein, partial [Chitinophaga varians]|uniref:hypothetical protein n=1 Tax=Chitinophaga varians TaxID=2202339 RepID=UPI001CB757BE
PYIFVLFLEELLCVSRRLRWGCKGSDSFQTTKTFLKFFFIFNYLGIKHLSNQISPEKDQCSTLIINPFIGKEPFIFGADGKDIIFIIRKQKLFQLNC